MASHFKFSLRSILWLIVLLALILHPTPALADGNLFSALPDLDSFSHSLFNGQPDDLRGVYVPYILAMPVVQQPLEDAGYISVLPNAITEFHKVREIGNVGLLAHNTLGGARFSRLSPGQKVTLIYGNGRMEDFVVRTILKFQALDPSSPYSEFRDLSTGDILTSSELFWQVYRGEHHITFQTCIEAEGNASWGRLFVIAEPERDASGLYVHHVASQIAW